MIHRIWLQFAITLVVLGSLCSQAIPGEVLHFDQRTLRFNPSSDDMIVTATFSFENATDRTVTLTKVAPSCGCVVIQPGVSVLKPGEHSEIIATFELGNLGGIQVKYIMISTDHPDEREIPLTMEVTIPPTPIISGGNLTWEQGKPEPTTGFSVTIPPGFPFALEGVIPSDPRLTAHLVPTPDPQRTAVVVNVNDASHPFTARIDISMKGSKKLFHVKAMVIPAAKVDAGVSPAPEQK